MKIIGEHKYWIEAFTAKKAKICCYNESFLCWMSEKNFDARKSEYYDLLLYEWKFDATMSDFGAGWVAKVVKLIPAPNSLIPAPNLIFTHLSSKCLSSLFVAPKTLIWAFSNYENLYGKLSRSFFH